MFQTTNGARGVRRGAPTLERLGRLSMIAPSPSAWTSLNPLLFSSGRRAADPNVVPELIDAEFQDLETHDLREAQTQGQGAHPCR